MMAISNYVLLSSLIHTPSTTKQWGESVGIGCGKKRYTDLHWNPYRHKPNGGVRKHGRKNVTSGRKRLGIYRGKLQAGKWRVDDVRQNGKSKRNQIRRQRLHCVKKRRSFIVSVCVVCVSFSFYDLLLFDFVLLLNH